MSLITSIKKDIKAVFEHDPAATSTLEGLERRVAELEQHLAVVEGSKDEGI